jgi:purine-binding chemotaxis protein CheW
MHETRDVVTFTAATSVYGVPVGRVCEILDLRPVAPLPGAAPHLLGLIDLRGTNVVVADLRLLLGLAPAEDTLQTRILVLWTGRDEGSALAGLRVDRVIEVARLDDGGLQKLPDLDGLRNACPGLAGVGRRDGAMINVLDIARLLAGVPAAGAVEPAPGVETLMAAE